MTAALILFLKLYQKLTSWFLPTPSCRFWPSCSDYTICALRRYGVVIGLRKGLGRLMRCQGFSHGGYDPLK